MSPVNFDDKPYEGGGTGLNKSEATTNENYPPKSDDIPCDHIPEVASDNLSKIKSRGGESSKADSGPSVSNL
jgi:hypothetical protein